MKTYFSAHKCLSFPKTNIGNFVGYRFDEI